MYTASEPGVRPGPERIQGLSQMPPLLQRLPMSTWRGADQLRPPSVLSVMRMCDCDTCPSALRARPMKVMRSVPSEPASSTGSLAFPSASVTLAHSHDIPMLALVETPMKAPPRAPAPMYVLTTWLPVERTTTLPSAV